MATVSLHVVPAASLSLMSLISGVTKGGPGRTQALPTTCCALPLYYQLRPTSNLHNKDFTTSMWIMPQSVYRYSVSYSYLLLNTMKQPASFRILNCDY